MPCGMSQPQNLLYYGDNLDILRRYIDDESVDLIYLDPSCEEIEQFTNSHHGYNVLFAEEDGTPAHAQIKASRTRGRGTWKPRRNTPRSSARDMTVSPRPL